MSQYQAIEQLHRCIGQLEQQLRALQTLLGQPRLLAARVFELPQVSKGKEHDPLPAISVTQHLAQAALTRALSHYGLLFMQQQSEQRSTKAAVRLPGAICLETTGEQAHALRQQVASVNQLKTELEKIVTVDSGVPADARFEFVHQQLPGLLTLNAYRNITLLEAPDSVRFGWANKQIIQRVDRRELREKLMKSLQAGRASGPFTREQWAARLQQEIALLDALPAHARLKIRRPVKVQPIARIWQASQQKQTQLACPSPLLILCADASQLPVIGELPDYDESNIRHRHKPEAQTLWPLIPRLHLYSDCPL